MRRDHGLGDPVNAIKSSKRICAHSLLRSRESSRLAFFNQRYLVGRVGIEISSQVNEAASLSQLGFGKLPPILPPDDMRLASPDYTYPPFRRQHRLQFLVAPDK